MVFVADEIPESLQRIAESLNETMDQPQVLVVEICQSVGRSPARATLVPRVYGQTAAAAAKGGTSGTAEQWTEERWWSVLTARDPHAAEAIRPVIEWARARMGGIWMGKGERSRRRPFDQLALRRELRDRLHHLPNVSIPDDKLDKRPGIPMVALAEPVDRERFTATIEWVLEQLEDVTD